MRRFVLCAVLVSLVPATAMAQQWTPIGTTKRDGTRLFVKTKSVKRAGDTVTALILARFAQATWDPTRKDSLRAMTTLATFNCKLDKVAVKENTYFVNFDKNRIAEHRVVKKPGYGVVFSAAFVVVRDYLCPAAKK